MPPISTLYPALPGLFGSIERSRRSRRYIDEKIEIERLDQPCLTLAASLRQQTLESYSSSDPADPDPPLH
jgi:hypothetical protein